MPFRFRKRVRLGFLPVFLNFSRSGFSWSVKLGPWSWNSRQRRQRLDLPGPAYWEEAHRPGSRAAGHHTRGRQPDRQAGE